MARAVSINRARSSFTGRCEEGYAMVDGLYKSHFSEESAAKEAATELLARYSMLQVEIYDALTKTRMRVQAKALVE